MSDKERWIGIDMALGGNDRIGRYAIVGDKYIVIPLHLIFVWDEETYG
jgi:hypothetical protein